MTMLTRWAALVAATAALAGAPRTVSAQTPADSTLGGPMARRATLERLADGFAGRTDSASRAALARIRERLAHGDFPPGARIYVAVQGDTALTDTFAVASDTTVRFPSPTVGVLPLAGVLRSELQDTVQRYIARFVVHPVVRAEPLVRLSIQGGVLHAGFYDVAVDAPISEAFMAAGGATPEAEMDHLRLERDDRTLLEGHALHDAIAQGLTVSDAGLRDGDEFVVPIHRAGGFTSGLQLVWALVSIAGGVYGLSRAF